MPCSPGMRACKIGCKHRAFVAEYATARLAAVEKAEAASIGYATEYAEYLQAHPLITFKDWLIGYAQPRDVADISPDRLEQVA